MLRSFTTTTSSQVIREKVRGVQNFKILVGTTAHRPPPAGRRYAARAPPNRRRSPRKCTAIAGRVRRPACLNSRRPAA